MKVDAERVHDREHDREHQRNAQRDHDAGAPAERDEAHQQHDGERLEEGLDELRNRVLDDVRLVGDLGHLDADRKRLGDRLHRDLEVLAELDDVDAVLHRHAEAERRLAVLPYEEGRRVLVTAGDRRDVAEPECSAAGLDRNRGDRFGTGERPGDAQIDAIRGGVDRAARCHRVLPRDAVEDLLRRDAERRELGVVDLDEDLLRPLADDVDFVDVGHAQQLLADVFGAGLEVGEAHAVRGQHVERGIDVAVLVVEARPDDAGGQIAPDVADLLAHLVPQLLHLGGWRAVEEKHLDERHPRLRIALDAVEVRKLLQLLLDPVGDLGLHLARGGAGPGGGDDHGLDGEGRVFGAPEVEIGIGPRPAEHDDHEEDERAVRDRPF
jgi:hypothetical protein